MTTAMAWLLLLTPWLLLLTPWLVDSQQLYQRVSTISHTSLQDKDALIQTLASSHPLHCASLCINSANMDGNFSGCNAFALDETGCTLANLYMLEERTEHDMDWPQVMVVVVVVIVVVVMTLMETKLSQLTMAATSLVDSRNLRCHGGEGCCREAR